MNKKWKLSDTGLQVYEGLKHVATVHYAGNPSVDVNEAKENALLVAQAPQQAARIEVLIDRIAALEAELETTKKLLKRDSEHLLEVGVQNAKLIAALELGTYILTIPAVRDIMKSQLEGWEASPIADFERVARAVIAKVTK